MVNTFPKLEVSSGSRRAASSPSAILHKPPPITARARVQPRCEDGAASQQPQPRNHHLLPQGKLRQAQDERAKTEYCRAARGGGQQNLGGESGVRCG